MRIAALLVIALLLAGCSDTTPVPDEPAEGPAPKEVSVGKDTGAISGVIVDVSISPIAGATIALGSLNLTTQSDEGGAFVFSDLTPGTYLLIVSAPGFRNVQVSATVTAGQVAKPHVQLEAEAVTTPIHYTLKHSGRIEFSGAVAGGITNILLREIYGEDPSCTCGMDFNTEGQNLTALVVEAFWTPTVTDPNPFCANCLYLEVFPAELDDGTDDIHGGFLPGPIYKNYPYEAWDADHDENNVDWHVNLSGNGYWINIGQDYELFVTVFANAPPPEGWSINGDQ